jgi:hypothetical protein
MRTTPAARLLPGLLAAGLALGLLGGVFLSVHSYLARRDGTAKGFYYPPPPTRPGGGLYADDEARRLIDGWGLNADPERCHLGVVPGGEAAPLGDVLGELGLDLNRLGALQVGGVDHVYFLTWQLSPSYDLCCVAPKMDLRQRRLEFEDPRHLVYAFQIVKRTGE